MKLRKLIFELPVYLGIAVLLLIILSCEKQENNTLTEIEKKEGWVFLGSRFYKHDQTKEDIFAAKSYGNLIVTWHDFDAMLDTPLSEGADDTTYRANDGEVPERGTEVTLVITPHKKHNKKWRKKMAEEKKKGPKKPPKGDPEKKKKGK